MNGISYLYKIIKRKGITMSNVSILKENMHRFKTKNLTEQEATAIRVATLSPAGSKIYKMFLEYLKQNPKTTWNDSDVILNHLDKLKNIKDEDVADVTDFFKTKGISPKNADVEAFQKDLGVQTFTTPNGIKGFVDGIFGIATALAAINYHINFKKKMLLDEPRNITYKQKADKDAKRGPIRVQTTVPGQIATSPNVNISTGTQPLQ